MNLGRKDWNNWNDVLVHIKRDIERVHWNLGYPSIQHCEKLFRDATVGGEGIQALKRVSCDACSRLKQPPARRQVAIAHAEMFNAVIPMDVNFWKLKERSSREKKTLTFPNIVEAASGMLMASRVPN